MTMFLKKRILSDILFDDIRFDLTDREERPAAIRSSDTKRSDLEVSLGLPTNYHINPEVRKAVYIPLDNTHYPDFNKAIEELCAEFDPKQSANNLQVRELEYLRYGLSDHFQKHQDVGFKTKKKRPRRYTSITMLSKTDDMVGGQLSVFEGDRGQYKEHVVDLQVGETVIFFSTSWHGVTAVTKGGREVLVAWVYDNTDS